MRIVGLVGSEGHVCTRYRLRQFAPALAAAGHSLTIVAYPRDWLGRLRALRSLRSADAVVVQRLLLPRAELLLLRRYSRTLIFDTDDAVWLRDSYSRKGFDSPRRARRFRATVRRCDGVAAGNAYLADEARKYANDVAVIPTCVDPSLYPPAPKPSGGLTLVWVGSASTLQGLDRFRETLERVGREVPGVRLKLVCDRFLRFEHLPVDEVPWSEAGEAAAIASADAGIGWVPDDPWSRGKCGLKILQYQAAGLPVVANPVGVQAEFVRDGETGIVAETPEQWMSAVKRLAADAGLRRRLGERGRSDVERLYSVSAGANMWLESLERWAGVTRC